MEEDDEREEHGAELKVKHRISRTAKRVTKELTYKIPWMCVEKARNQNERTKEEAPTTNCLSKQRRQGLVHRVTR